MTTVDLERPGRALAIGAHPDDIEFGCGATLAKWNAAGSTTVTLVLTDGSKGSWDPRADLGELVTQRRNEQRAAAEVLGVADIESLDLVDGELEPTREIVAAIAAVIRRVRPDALIGHDPWTRYRLHPDHRHAGFLTLDAVVAARDPHFFPEQGLAAHRPATLLLFEAEEPDHVERVDATIDRKIHVLLAHRSQWRSTMGIDPDGDVTAERDAFAERIRTRAIADGARAGVALGEAFKRIDDL